MCVYTRTLTVKASCILMLETEITTDISWDNEASGALAYEYSAVVLCAQNNMIGNTTHHKWWRIWSFCSSHMEKKRLKFVKSLGITDMFTKLYAKTGTKS